MTERLNFYKDLYFKEVDRAYSLLNLSAVLITIITGIFTAIYFLADKIYSLTITNSIAFYGVVSMVSLSFLSLLVALYYFIRYFFDRPQHLFRAGGVIHWYKGYDIRKWEEYYTDLKKYYDTNTEANSDFFESLTSQTAQLASHNTEANDRRSIYFYSTIQFCFVSLLFLLISSPAFLYLNHIQPIDAVVYNCTNKPKNLSIMSKTNVTTTGDAQPPASQKPPQPTPQTPKVKPQPPPPRDWGTQNPPKK
jgi:hypothetical protein